MILNALSLSVCHNLQAASSMTSFNKSLSS